MTSQRRRRNKDTDACTWRSIKYGGFRIKGRHQRRHKVGTDSAVINWWDYTRKHSTIASGATTIRSTERAPDEISKKTMASWSMMIENTIFEPILETHFFDYSLEGYSHWERWARTRRCLSMSTRAWKAKEYTMTHRYSHREQVFMVV
jgi:hypothetical protein